MRDKILGTVVAVALAIASFTAGSTWKGRRQVQIEVARGKFFEAAQGQFHWPEDRKEWAEMLVPLGGFDFSEYGKSWSFTAMYEGVRDRCELRVVVEDARGGRVEAVVQALDRAVPEEVALDLAAVAKAGIDLRHVTQLTLRTKSDGRAGRLLVSGLVSPRPALSAGTR